MVHNGHRVSREWFAPALRVKFQQGRFVQPHCPHSPAATSVADLIVEGVPGGFILAVLWQEVNYIPVALNGNIKTPEAHHVHKTANLDQGLLRDVPGHPSKEDLGRVGRVGTCSSCPDQVQEACKTFRASHSRSFGDCLNHATTLLAGVWQPAITDQSQWRQPPKRRFQENNPRGVQKCREQFRWKLFFGDQIFS